MSKPISWVERTGDGVKREIRVTFAGANGVRWQSQRADEERWTYDFRPTAEQWDALMERAEARYRRRSVSWKLLELIKRLRSEAGE